MKTAQEVRYLRSWGITPYAEVCGNCKHFMLHYIYDPLMYTGAYSPLWEGHCMAPRCKPRKITDTCNHFERMEG